MFSFVAATPLHVPVHARNFIATPHQGGSYGTTAPAQSGLHGGSCSADRAVHLGSTPETSQEVWPTEPVKPLTGGESQAFLLLLQDLHSPSLTLSSSLPPSQDIPRTVWRINIDPPSDDVISFSTGGDDRWWEQTDLTKLILAGNLLRSLSEDIRCLPALSVLDVREEGCGGGGTGERGEGGMEEVVESEECITRRKDSDLSWNGCFKITLLPHLLSSFSLSPSLPLRSMIISLPVYQTPLERCRT